MNKLRQCVIKDQQKGESRHALFHCWSQEFDLVAPSMMVGGHNGGVVGGTFALVEEADGSCRLVRPSNIVFIDENFQRQFVQIANQAKGWEVNDVLRNKE